MKNQMMKKILFTISNKKIMTKVLNKIPKNKTHICRKVYK